MLTTKLIYKLKKMIITWLVIILTPKWKQMRIDILSVVPDLLTSPFSGFKKTNPVPLEPNQKLFSVSI